MVAGTGLAVDPPQELRSNRTLDPQYLIDEYRYDLAPLHWADVRRTLETNLTQEPGTGGPGHHTFWLSTIDADGRPHMTAVGAFWVDGRYYFSAVAIKEPGGATRWSF